MGKIQNFEMFFLFKGEHFTDKTIARLYSVRTETSVTLPQLGIAPQTSQTLAR
jgi:hypothetical protein